MNTIRLTNSGSGTVIPFPLEQTRRTISENVVTWRANIIKRLENLVRLDNGWDGYNAPPVSFANASFALQMLDSICEADAPTPQAVPGTTGDLQIEWHTFQGDVELHVIGPNRVHAWRRFSGDTENGLEADLTNDFRPLIAWIQALTEPEVVHSAAAA